MSVHPSGFYAWLKERLSQHAKEDQRLLGSVVKFISTIEELRRSGGRLEILMPFFQSGRIAAYNA